MILDGELRKDLAECIGDIESNGSSLEACLERYPDRASELRPHLELWHSLNASPKAEPAYSAQQRGEHRLLAALQDGNDPEGEGPAHGVLVPAPVRVIAVLAVVGLLAGGAAGASAALGGPDFADEILSSIGVTTGNENVHDNTEAAPAAEDGHDTADRGGDNRDGAPPAADDGRATADRGGDNRDGAPPAAEDGRSTADEAPQGAGDVDLPTVVPSDVPGPGGPQPPPDPDSHPNQGRAPDSAPGAPGH